MSEKVLSMWSFTGTKRISKLSNFPNFVMIRLCNVNVSCLLKPKPQATNLNKVCLK